MRSVEGLWEKGKPSRIIHFRCSRSRQMPARWQALSTGKAINIRQPFGFFFSSSFLSLSLDGRGAIAMTVGNLLLTTCQRGALRLGGCARNIEREPEQLRSVSRPVKQYTPAQSPAGTGERSGGGQPTSLCCAIIIVGYIPLYLCLRTLRCAVAAGHLSFFFLAFLSFSNLFSSSSSLVLSKNKVPLACKCLVCGRFVHWLPSARTAARACPRRAPRCRQSRSSAAARSR